MKRMLGIVSGVLALATALGGLAVSQETRPSSARDMYTSYRNGAAATQGRPGVKVSIRLRRDGRERLTSADEKFYSGDAIKLVLDTNFTGYVAVINTGSTGRRTLLYPQADDAVFPADGAVLPPAEDKWIVFDDNPGDERMALIFSSQPLGLQAQRPPAQGGAAPPRQPAPEHSSNGGLADEQDAQSVLDELNTRALSRGRTFAASRDMFTETVGNETYSVASQGTLSEPIGFEFKMRHAKR